MASAPIPPPSKPLDIELTIVSAKHLKNVNWRNGDLKPYTVFWADPDRRLSTRADDSGSTRPVWNERFTLPLNLPLHDSILTLEIFHSRPSETPKPLVGTLRVELKDLHDPEDSTRIRTYYLVRPSGRPQGKIRVKLGVRERPLPPPQVYHPAAPPSYYYGGASLQYPRPPYISVARPPPPPVSPPPTPPPAPYSAVAEYLPYPSYYYPVPSSLPPQPPLPPRPVFGGSSSYEGPSAPVDYSPYDQKPRGGGKTGFGAGLGVGAVAASMGGLALDEGLKYEEEKTADRVEHEVSSRERDDYSDYHARHRMDY